MLLSLKRKSRRVDRDQTNTFYISATYRVILLALAVFVSGSSFRQYLLYDVNALPSVLVGGDGCGVSAFQQQIFTNHPIAATTNYNPFASRLFVYPSLDDNGNTNNEQETRSSSLSPSSSLSFALDPTSEIARKIVLERLRLSSEQYQKLAKLAILVKDMNSSINLISRKDCTTEVIFGRHIIPSLAPLTILKNNVDDVNSNGHSYEGGLVLSPGQRVCDVGTGGGFPGLPLAIALPDVEFLLVDSVGKKITAVQQMADQLGLINVKTFHGRAESISIEDSDEKFSWVLGRSVAAIPSFCSWVYHLLQKQDGRLVYLIGGDIDAEISDQAIITEEIEDLLGVKDISDKRVLVFPQQAVDKLAKSSGEKLRGGTGAGKGTARKRHNKNNQRSKGKSKARGQWDKRDSSAKKQRGYDDFQRFDSLQR